MRALIFASSLAAFTALAACSPYDPNLTSEPFLCGAQSPPCPDGFSCVSNGSAMVCMGSGPASPDGGGGSGFKCADDSMLEPNDTIDHATASPVAGERPSITFGPLAICPAGDKDIFSVNIVVNDENQTLTATVAYNDGDPLQVSILNNTGNVLMAGSPIPGMANMEQAVVGKLPAGTDYVQVSGPVTPGASGGENNYTVTIAVSSP